MKDKYKLYKNVVLGDNYNIGEFVIVGHPPKGESDGSLKTIIGENAVIRSHTTIYSGNIIGNNFQTGHHVMIREFNKIGRNVSIGTLSVIEHHVKIGNNVRIHSQAFIPEYTVLEDDCWIGPNVVVTNALYPLSPDVKKKLKGPTIKKGSKIGANATLLPGILIGENSLIGAGSVVTKNVPKNSVVAGNPAKVIKMISDLPY